MKNILLFIITGLIIGACSSAKKTPASKPIARTTKSSPRLIVTDITAESPVVNEDTTDYFQEKKYVVEQVINKKDLLVYWNVVAMYRQRNARADSVKDVSLKFMDTHVWADGPCSMFTAPYELNGSDIIITTIGGTKKNYCKQPALDMDTTFRDLLEHKVKHLTLEDSKLLLQDKAGNLVFICEKRGDN